MSRARRRFSPSVSTLEGRALLSTFTVLNNNDSGPDSLRAEVALANASPGSTVDFDPSVTGTISLTSGEIAITAPMVIDGPGAGVLSINAGGLSRIFNVSGVPTPSTPVEIEGLAFEDGSASTPIFAPLSGGDGGAIQVDGSVVVLHDDVFVDNFAKYRGGAIFNQSGMLTVDNCSFSNNSTEFHGGAIYNSGHEIVPAAASLGVINSVFSGNVAGEGGGAIEDAEAVFSDIGLTTVKASVVSSVFTNNSSEQFGGAISVDNTGFLSVVGSVFTNNSTDGDGGAISSRDIGPYGGLSVVGSKFFANSSANRGGAIYSEVPLALTGSVVEFDVSALPLLAGGGVHAKLATFTGVGNTIIFNTPDDLILV